ncbi:hypothetical protein [Planctomicrobium sp. SH664]|uniref:hypothetical protein n=1 Tax=Planctomicrobium sp. SH664 TaxID=3448125 RepID=UPI003F5C2064
MGKKLRTTANSDIPKPVDVLGQGHIDKSPPAASRQLAPGRLQHASEEDFQTFEQLWHQLPDPFPLLLNLSDSGVIRPDTLPLELRDYQRVPAEWTPAAVAQFLSLQIQAIHVWDVDNLPLQREKAAAGMYWKEIRGACAAVMMLQDFQGAIPSLDVSSVSMLDALHELQRLHTEVSRMGELSKDSGAAFISPAPPPDGPTPHGIRLGGVDYRLTPRARKAALKCWYCSNHSISLIDASDDHAHAIKVETAKKWQREFNEATAGSGWEMTLEMEHITIRRLGGQK